MEGRGWVEETRVRTGTAEHCRADNAQMRADFFFSVVFSPSQF